MKKTMTALGIGRKLGLVLLPFLFVTVWAGHHFAPMFAYDHITYALLLGIGIGLIVIGLLMNSFSARYTLNAFKQGRLVTGGPFAVTRNPMYASFIFLTIPGLSLSLNNWLVALCSIALYAGLHLLIVDEEKWLEEKFGAEYVAYKKHVGLVFPKFFRN